MSALDRNGAELAVGDRVRRYDAFNALIREAVTTHRVKAIGRELPATNIAPATTSVQITGYGYVRADSLERVER